MRDTQAIEMERLLVARAQAGSHDAFADLVRKHSGQVYGISMKMLKNREDAEDNLQNVFCKAYNNLAKFEGNSQFSTWLIRIAINEALMKLRTHKSEATALAPDSNVSAESHEEVLNIRDTRPNPEREYIAKELAAIAFEGLHPALRDTFVLHKREGWTNRELAKASGVTVETIKSRIFRARIRLRQQLQNLAEPSSIAFQG